jgi:hypothetical protein
MNTQELTTLVNSTKESTIGYLVIYDKDCDLLIIQDGLIYLMYASLLQEIQEELRDGSFKYPFNRLCPMNIRQYTEGLGTDVVFELVQEYTDEAVKDQPTVH